MKVALTDLASSFKKAEYPVGQPVGIRLPCDWSMWSAGPNRPSTFTSGTIETEQKLSLGGWQLAMADDASHAIDTDRVIAALERRALPLAYRVRLGQALDRANAPQTGKAGADEAVGRAVGAKARDFGVVWKV